MQVMPNVQGVRKFLYHIAREYSMRFIKGKNVTYTIFSFLFRFEALLLGLAICLFFSLTFPQILSIFASQCLLWNSRIRSFFLHNIFKWSESGFVFFRLFLTSNIRCTNKIFQAPLIQIFKYKIV